MASSTKATKTWRSWQAGAELRWYLNDASLQAQFADRSEFEAALSALLALRARIPAIRRELRSTRSLPEALVSPEVTVRRAVFEFRDKDMRAAIFSWLDKNGPFVEEDRLPEADDYFEYRHVEVTATGLGEATRRTKAGLACATYSFVGGAVDFTIDPLEVDHGLPEERYGRYSVANAWGADALADQAATVGAPIQSWADLAAAARQRFPHLEIGPIEENPSLAREPFEASLRDRSLELMKLLNSYVAGRNLDGSEGPASREIVQTYFTGERALFTGESATNRVAFESEMSFRRTTGGHYLAHWHGKISHRYFRLHFEWPLEKSRKKLEVFYLGPKITKS